MKHCSDLLHIGNGRYAVSSAKITINYGITHSLFFFLKANAQKEAMLWRS